MDELPFFGPDGESRPEREIREAKAKVICASCPVQVQCLDYALGKSITHGIWVGLTRRNGHGSAAAGRAGGTPRDRRKGWR